MRGDAKVIEHLNIQLTNELTAVNQYFLHARLLDHWGVTKFAKYEYGESIEEMKHADELIQRILFLDGHPNVQRLNTILTGQTVEEVLECDAKLEVKAIADLKEAIAHCEQVRDYVSRDLFFKILADEEHHQDWIDTQQDLIRQIGIQNYIQLQSGAAGEGKAD